MNPSLTTLVKRALHPTKGECALAPTTKLLIAVSGGPDSMALLDVLALIARTTPDLGGLELVAHGIDHGLRKEAATELDLAEAHASKHGIAFHRTRVKLATPEATTTNRTSPTHLANLQARAREARWTALIAAARKAKASVIATAHHADDRAETFLMRLLRGAGTRGLAVLPPSTTAEAFAAKDIRIVRPMLRATRADVLLHLERHAVPFATDPSNADPHYLRTRMRHEVLPLLAQIDPQVVRHLEALADELTALSESGPGRTDHPLTTWMTSLPRATQRAITTLFAAGTPSSSAKTQIWLPGGFVLSKDDRAGRASRNASSRTRSSRGPVGRTKKKPTI